MLDFLAAAFARAYIILLPLGWVTLAIAGLVLLPLALYRPTRVPGSVGLMLASWVIGAVTWCLAAVVTFSALGWVWLVIGLVLFGVGVVPLAIIASAVVIKNLALTLSLLGMVGITIAARYGGAILLDTER